MSLRRYVGAASRLQLARESYESGEHVASGEELSRTMHRKQSRCTGRESLSESDAYTPALHSHCLAVRIQTELRALTIDRAFISRVCQ